MSKELLGMSLPDGAFEWLGALVAVFLTVGGTVRGASAYIERESGVKRPFAKLEAIVPHISWLLWSAALVYAHPGAASVLLLIAGLMVIAIAREAMVARRKRSSE